MAEVKRGNGASSLSLKKPPSFSHTSSSYKHIYDDVFVSHHHSRQQSSAFIDDDYAEMFGSSKSDNGAWSITYSSIPVLDLPPPSEMRVRGVSGVTSIAGESRVGEVDYEGVFGGVGAVSFGLPDGEELFDQFKMNTRTSSAHTIRKRSKGQKKETVRSEISGQSQICPSPTNGFCQSLHSTEHHEQKNNVVASKRSGELAKAACARDMPKCTDSNDLVGLQRKALFGNQHATIDDIQIGKNENRAKKQEKHLRHTSLDLGTSNDQRHSGLVNGSGSSGLVASDASRETCQLGKASTNGQPLSSANHIECMSNNLSTAGNRDATCAAEVYSAKLCSDTLHEVDPNQQIHSSIPPVIKVDNAYTVDPNRLNLSSKPHVVKGDTSSKDVDPIETPENQCRSTSMDLSASNQSSEHFTCFQNVSISGSAAVCVPQPMDAALMERQRSWHSTTSLNLGESKQSSKHLTGFQKVSTNGSITVDVPQGTCQVDHEAGPPNTVSDVDVGGKKARHSRMTSLDLGDHNHLHERDVRFNRKSRFGGSYSFDGSHDPCAARIKVQPSMMAPSPSLPQFFPIESRYKVSENASFQSYETNVHIGGGGGSPPSLDEQLDMNSAAALAAAALQSAMEEAAMIIRLAKEYLERESQGSTQLRFKDTLKVIPGKNEQEADEMTEFPQTHKRTPTVGSGKQFFTISNRSSVLVNDPGFPVNKDQKKSIQDEQVFKLQNKFFQYEELLGVAQTVPVSEEQEKIVKEEPVTEYHKKFVQDEDSLEKVEPSVLEDKKKFVKEEPVFEHQKEITRDEECIEGKIGNVSKLIDESDRREGGVEWEAAKHLNQLISGVKNKIASFMAWQTETDKKEELKETEQSTEFQQQSEASDSVLKKVELQMQGADKNQDATDCAGETVHVELEIGFVSDAVELNDHESFTCNTAEQENVESELDTSQGLVGPASENLMFFPFRNDTVYGSTDTFEEERNTYQGSVEDEFKSVREQLLDEMKNEQIQSQCEKEDWEGVDDKCMGESNIIQNDMHSHESPNIEEVDEVMDEPYYFLDEQSREGPTFEEGHSRQFVEESGAELIHNSHISEVTEGITEEHVELKECKVLKEVEKTQCNMQIMKEPDLGVDMVKNPEATEIIHGCQETEMDQSQINDFEEAADNAFGWEDSETNESLATDHIEKTEMDESLATDHIEKTGEQVAEKACFFGAAEDVCQQTQSECIEAATEKVPEGTSYVVAAEDEYKQAETESEHLKKVSEQVDEQSKCFAAVEDECQQTENVFLSTGEEASRNDHSCLNVGDDVFPDKDNAKILETPNLSSKLKEDLLSAPKASQLIGEETLLPSENSVEFDGAKEHLNVNEILQHENFVVPSNQSSVCSGKEGSDVEAMDSKSLEMSENRSSMMHDSRETQNRVELEDNDQNVGNFGVEALPRRRRWFDSAIKVGPVDRLHILEGGRVDMETDQEFLDDSDLSGSVEIHADTLDSNTESVIAGKDAASALNLGSGSVDVEATPKRRRWFIKTGEEGLPEPPPLFQGIKVTLEDPQEMVNEVLPPLSQGIKVTSKDPQKMVNEVLRPSVSDSSLDKLNAENREFLNVTDADVVINGERDKKSVEATPRRRRWFESGENVGPASHLRINNDIGVTLETEQVSKDKGGIQNSKIDSMASRQGKDDPPSKVEPVNDHYRPLTEVDRREKEKEKEKIAVERVIREARERAFAEARERARRDAGEKPNVEARQRAGAQERLGKVSADSQSSSDKASMEAKLRAERAAVERATAEARERALQKALSEKDLYRSKDQAGKSDPKFHCSSSSARPDLSNKGEQTAGLDNESSQRSKAQLERQSRTMERAAKALEEKNRRDLLAQKEQAAKNMLADSLDAEVKRWSTGKEGNLRMLLSTLQYILGSDSGWQAISLTDLVAATAVRKAYKKATLCVHPDKLQQRGATIQQKYICEKVFELLKDAWSKFSPDER